MRPLLTLAALSILPVLAAGPVRDLRVSEGFVNPIGFYDATPSFSWKLPEGVRAQNAYRIVAASAADKLPDSADLWDSGKVSSAQSAWLAYAGKPLGSRQAVHWQVRFWDQDGNESSWSEPARFELGLLDADDWQGEWIRMAEKPAAPAPKVVIEKASYIADGQPDKAIDLTKKLRKRLADGQSTFTVNNEFAGGDPLYGTPKSLALVVIRDGKREEASIPENQSYDLLTGKPAGAAEPFVPQHLRREFEVEKPVKQARLHVTALGLYEIRLNGARSARISWLPAGRPTRRRSRRSPTTSPPAATGLQRDRRDARRRMVCRSPRVGGAKPAAANRSCCFNSNFPTRTAVPNDRQRRLVEGDPSRPDPVFRHLRWRDLRRAHGDAGLGQDRLRRRGLAFRWRPPSPLRIKAWPPSATIRCGL
jgi:hypothetical protein